MKNPTFLKSRQVGLILVITSMFVAQAQPSMGVSVKLKTESIKDSLQNLAESWLAAVRSRDFKQVAQFYDHSADFAHYEDGKSESWESMSRSINGFFSAMQTIDLRWQGKPVVILLGTNVAIVRGVHAFSGVDMKGQAVPGHRGLWTGVVERRSSGWVIVHSHSSDERPPKP